MARVFNTPAQEVLTDIHLQPYEELSVPIPDNVDLPGHSQGIKNTLNAIFKCERDLDVIKKMAFETRMEKYKNFVDLKRLIKAEHGSWKKWVEKHYICKYRNWNKYIQIHKGRETILMWCDQNEIPSGDLGMSDLVIALSGSYNDKLDLFYRKMRNRDPRVRDPLPQVLDAEDKREAMVTQFLCQMKALLTNSRFKVLSIEDMDACYEESKRVCFEE